jgi:hypothetical protein
MKAIETTAVVDDNRKLTVQLSPDVAPGPHHIVLVIDGPRSEHPQSWTIHDCPVHEAGLVDPNFTMRREELYGDDGR